MPRVAATLITTVILLGWAVLAAEAGEGRPITTRISLAGEGVAGAQERLRGRVVIRTPQALRRTNRDASPSARLTARLSDSCQVGLLVGTRALATRSGARRQARASVRGLQELGEGRRRGGVWAVAGGDVLGPSYEPTGETQLYGIGVVELPKPRRWLHVRAFATFPVGCTEGQRRDNLVIDAVERIARRARVQAAVERLTP